MLAPCSAFTSRVVPTPNGRGEVQRTSCRIRHQCSASSAVSSAHTFSADCATSKLARRRIGALSKNDSSTGLHLKQGPTLRASLPRRPPAGQLQGSVPLQKPRCHADLMGVIVRRLVLMALFISALALAVAGCGGGSSSSLSGR